MRTALRADFFSRLYHHALTFRVMQRKAAQTTGGIREITSVFSFCASRASLCHIEVVRNVERETVNNSPKVQ
jgi:hypothetical protein